MPKNMAHYGPCVGKILALQLFVGDSPGNRVRLLFELGSAFVGRKNVYLASPMMNSDAPVVNHLFRRNKQINLS